MRKKEREITGFDEIVQVIEQCKVLHLGMVDQGMPYIVPLNFGYRVEGEQLYLFVHCARIGRKITVLAQNPEVCFEMEHFLELGTGDLPCQWTAYYESVMGEGEILFLEETVQKQAAMAAIMEHNGYRGEMNFHPGVLERTQLLALKVKTLSGKRNVKEA